MGQECGEELKETPILGNGNMVKLMAMEYIPG